MPVIHLMFGFIGFGKTTVAKELAKILPAECLTHDDIMCERYGRNPDNFEEKYKIVDDFIREKTAEYIKQGRHVILDYGFWTHCKREEYYEWAKTLTDDVVFHDVECDLAVAKQRVLNRTQNDKTALIIDEHTFEILLKQYEPWISSDNYPVVLHNAPVTHYIGKTVKVKMDRPLGSKHPKYNYEYPVNYGFIPFTKSGDGEELDAYVLGVNTPLQEYIGECIGIIHRTDDDDDKLIVVPQATKLTDEDIEKEVAFQEKWFKHTLLRAPL